MGDNIVMSISMRVEEHQSKDSLQLQISDGKENSVRHSKILEILRRLPNQYHRDMIDQVENIWNEIGFPDTEIEKRLLTFRDAFDSALTAILSTGLEKQIDYKKVLDERIAKYQTQITENELFLDVKSYSTQHTSEGTFNRETTLRVRCNELIALRQERQMTLNSLLAENRKYSRALEVPAMTLPTVENQLRTQFLEDFRSINMALEATFNDRSAQMDVLRTRIFTVCQEIRNPVCDIDWEDLSQDNIELAEEKLNEMIERRSSNVSTANSLYKRIMYLSNRIGIPSEFIDSNPSIQELFFDPDVISQLEEEKSRLETEAKQNIRSLVLKQRDSILSMFDKVYASKEERTAFKELLSDDFSEELLDAHETELERLREWHDNNRQIYTLLDDHSELAQKKCKYEEQEMDPEIMKNRGGILLKIQAEKKKIVKDLMKVTSDLHVLISQVTTNSEVPFLISGMTLDNYLAHRQEVFDATKPGHSKGRKANDPPSAIKRKALKDTPAAKRLKNELTSGANQINVSLAAAKKADASDTTTVRNMGPVARRINFNEKGASPNRNDTPSCGNTSSVSVKIMTPRTAMGKR